MEKPEKRDSRYFTRSYQIGLGWTPGGNLSVMMMDTTWTLGRKKIAVLTA
jgi:hypothetical protein